MASAKQTSKQHLVRIPDDLWLAASSKAQQDDRSVSSMIVRILRDALISNVKVEPAYDTPESVAEKAKAARKAMSYAESILAARGVDEDDPRYGDSSVEPEEDVEPEPLPGDLRVFENAAKQFKGPDPKGGK